MTAAAAESTKTFERWTYRRMMMKTGVKAWKGATCSLNTATGLVQPAVNALATQLFLGVFAETIDNTTGGAAVPVNVDFFKEKTILWRTNDGTISAANLGQPAYFLDDLTLTLTATGASKAGTILAVDTVLGVAIEVEGV